VDYEKLFLSLLTSYAHLGGILSWKISF